MNVLRPERLTKHRSAGQILIMFAAMLPMMLMLTAFGVDIAYLYVERRHLQSAADLAALGGAIDLPSSNSAMVSATSIASSNGYANGVDGVSVAVQSPYDGSSDKIAVTLNKPVDTFFLSLVGMDTMTLSGRAVAHRTGGSYAIFANFPNCGGSKANETIQWSGSNVTVAGNVHSNTGFKFSGSDNGISGAASYGCHLDVSGSSNSFGSGPSVSPQKAMPISYTAGDFTPCTYTRSGDWDLSSDGAWWVGGKKDSKQLRPGVYCATGSSGSIKLSDSGISGNVTFVAPRRVEISGSNFTLTPFMHDVLMYSASSADDAIKLSGSGGTWGGFIYAPNGQVEISGSSNLTIQGSIIANKVKLSGSNWSIASQQESSGRARLLE